MLEHAAAALFLDPGLRKTSITLAALKILIGKKLVSKVLVVAPIQVCYSVWPAEVSKWTDFNELKLCILHGPDKEALLQADEHQIYVINPEGIDWLLDVTKSWSPQGKRKRVEVNMTRWKSLGFDALVIDELTMFKNMGSDRTKGLKQVLHTFGRRWGLTGSPMANRMMDLFGQCFMLDQGRTLGPYISHFRKQYFTPSYDGFSWVLKEGADQIIYKRLKPLALRMDADDYIDLPKVIENDIKLRLPPDVLKAYLALEEDLVMLLKEGKVTAATAATASMKCRQVANGGVYLDQEVKALIKLPKSQREWVDLHDEKTEAIAQLVDELQGSPLLVAYDFGHDLARLQKRLGKDVPYVGGGVSPKRRKELEELWNRGDLPVLLAHPQTAARGLNLQESGFHVAWHSLTWDYELYDQFIRRIRRSGQKAKRVYVHHLIMSGTIDETIMQALATKARGQDALFKALKEMHRS